MILFGPIITAFVSSYSYYKFAELLEDKKNVELLLLEIERLENLSKNKTLESIGLEKNKVTIAPKAIISPWAKFTILVTP